MNVNNRSAYKIKWQEYIWTKNENIKRQLQNKKQKYVVLGMQCFKSSLLFLFYKLSRVLIVFLYVVLCLTLQRYELWVERKKVCRKVCRKVGIRGSKCLRQSPHARDDLTAGQPKALGDFPGTHSLWACECGHRALLCIKERWILPSSTFNNPKQRWKVWISTFTSASFDIVNNISMSDFPITLSENEWYLVYYLHKYQLKSSW